ncbi:MAG: hypothetical protein Q8P13_02500 [bacterium]|nr:hypothetical protein [bacterium]
MSSEHHSSGSDNVFAHPLFWGLLIFLGLLILIFGGIFLSIRLLPNT